MITFQKYQKVSSIEEAYELNQAKNNKIVGGMLWLRLETTNYNTIIDISDLGLNKIVENDSEFKIGAMVTLRELELHHNLNEYTNNSICKALKDIIGVQFRNLATVGGSIWGRFGFSDVLTVLLAFDSYVELYKGGIVSLEDFSKMSYDNDILLNIIIKKKNSKCVYDSVRIQRTDFPVLTCATSVIDEQLRIVVGARPGKAIVYHDNSNILKNKDTLSTEAISKYVSNLNENIPTSSNNRGSAEYRKKLVNVLANRCLLQLGELL